MNYQTTTTGQVSVDAATLPHGDLPFHPKLHHMVSTGMYAGAWRPNSAKGYGSRNQLAEARALRAAGRTVLPPDPLANPGLQNRFGALGKLLGIFK